ncbi:leucine efflux protein LeuE [Sutterella megalosphaeroides]|uniref:Putative membrane protein n=1 Tax=Sutterella megalosphaeroides TaxID=2494234 RepID=A0A2Z6IC50_9BURK|nr:leucine efflux protein LeuE [Sutterella megalosphaeroides]BBF24033.1 putative membrane protein [Sutterella megalosphaeroides]
MLESIGVVDVGTYALGSLLIVLCPGPNSIFVLKTGITSGPRVALAGACGVFLGDTVLMLATYLGVAAVIAANPGIFFAVKLAGAAYLAYLASRVLWGTWRPVFAHEAGVAVETPGKEAPWRDVLTGVAAFRTALTLSLTNPKAILFFLSFFMPFIDASKGHPALAFLVLALILQFWSVCYMTSLAQIGQPLLKFFGRRPVFGRIGNTIVGLVFYFFAVKLVLG